MRWEVTEHVPMTTVDALSNRFGAPSFIKIDVEGYEPNVLQGMSVLPAHLSFELTLPECLDEALLCLDRLEALGARAFNYSLGEAMGLELDDWVDNRVLRLLLQERGPTFGDIIAAGP
jgi:hypothetical protein